jgi:hypothetical protein
MISAPVAPCGIRTSWTLGGEIDDHKRRAWYAQLAYAAQGTDAERRRESPTWRIEARPSGSENRHQLSGAANVREIQGKRTLWPSATNDGLCKGFRMPALCEYSASRSLKAGIRKPPRKETANLKGAVAAASYG